MKIRVAYPESAPMYLKVKFILPSIQFNSATGERGRQQTDHAHCAISF